MKWLLVGLMVAATTVGEVSQAMGMRRHGEIHDFRPGAIGRALASMARNRFVIGSIAAMAVSFFAFMKLLSMTDLSFAVPVSAVTYVMGFFDASRGLARVACPNPIDGTRTTSKNRMALRIIKTHLLLLRNYKRVMRM